MKKLFKIHDNNLVDELISQFGIVAHKNNDILEVDPNMYNYTIMGIMEIISNNQKYEKAFNAWFDSMDRLHEMPDFLYGKARAGGWEMYGSGINESIIMNYTVTEIKQSWENSKTKEKHENLGIENMNAVYIETNEIQETKYEYKKITKFLNLYKEHYAKNNNMSVDDIKIEFINYGKTELVYVLTDKLKNQYTLLVKQPKVSLGEVKKEAENLVGLNALHENIVAPVEYFNLYDQELFVTPYIYQARCIASDQKWGMYIPEPFYRFVPFTEEQESIVNQCMIAKLVSFYDFLNNEGIVSCKLGGGDFMLPKGWELEQPTIENTLNNLYFIAAREKLNCSFDEYTELLIQEFSKRTIGEDEDKFIINKRGRVPMNIIDIQNGIELGKKIIEDRKGFGLTKN